MVTINILSKMALAGGLALFGEGASALELTLAKGAKLTHEAQSTFDSYAFATGPYRGGSVPVVEGTGQIVQQAWRLDDSDLTTLQIIAPLREQLTEEGYDLLFECKDTECGNFDFRYGIDVVDAPDMFVDLYDYRYLSAQKEQEQGQKTHIAILVSGSGINRYVQIARSDPANVGSLDIRPDAAEVAALPKGVVSALVQDGHVVLDDLQFESGAVALSEGAYASLADLARYLNEDETRRVALVGHTDATGSAEANISLSRQRAAAVLERLVNGYGVDRLQLEADGVGYLSPVAANLSEDGREANRRVEAVLLNAE